MDPASVPLLAWHFVAVQKEINPMLVFCRGDAVHFLLVKKEESGAIHVSKSRQLHLHYDLISLTWINSRTLVLLDSAEKLHVIDRPSQEELDNVDIAEVELIYNSSHFKSLATGGNVSQALMTEILFQYADRSLKKCPEQGKIQVMEQHFQCFLGRDLLFNQIYSKLGENSVAKGVFLECLEPYILSDRLTGLAPHVMKDLLVHFQDNGMMDSIEACIVHLDITSLDIQQVVQMCWEHHLHDAMIYVYNSGMNDYINPMEKLLQVISPLLRAGKSLSDEKVTMGNKLLVYISCCLAGRAYPLGDIPEDLVPLVKNQVFEFLVRLHSVEAAPDEEVYPSIRTLLHFDTREFLNVLALTFEDFKNDKQALEYQQRIVDILLQVMVDNSDFTPSQVGCLFTFLARQLSKPDNTLFVNRKLFDQVIPRYQICEFMYEKKHLYDKIIYCYLKDPLRKELVSIDPSKAADLVAIHFADEIRNIIDKLEEDYLLFQFMKCLLDPREGSQNQRLLRLNPDLYELYIELLCRFSPAQVTEFLQTSEHYRMEEAVQITRKHNLHEPLAYLLEKKGDVHGAFLVLLEDPVYGRGKLSEIQGLILGMLETFSYEQTLLETTTSLLNHDLHWSLSHLRAAVSKGLHPRLDHCSICLQHYRRKLEADDEIIIFSCGHLYHCQCLQSKECGVQGEGPPGWSCYKCTSSSKGGWPGERAVAEVRRGRTTSLAQIKVTSVHNTTFGDACGRKLAILTELSHSRGSEKPSLLNPTQPGSGSIFHSENFQLKLSPPPLMEE
ncbi:UNVERIFIED_CONTAM: hypothetical protein FKN15_001270 [Acipenser sinensis]